MSEKMKSLSLEEVVAILSDMKIDIPVPKAATTQRKRNAALDMAISALSCSEIPNSLDYIRRQAAIEALRAIKYGLWEIDIPSPTVPEYVEHHEQIKNMMEIVDGWIKRIEGEPAVDVPDKKIGKWIPCKKKLPDKDGEYLVTYEKGYAEDYCFSDISIAPFEVDCEGFGIWQEHFHPVSLGSLGSEWVEIPVTAWMPLPEPYKEEEDGTLD